MPVKGALERYLVKPGEKVDLKKIDSGEFFLFEKGDLKWNRQLFR
jgi:hypothetical protein